MTGDIFEHLYSYVQNNIFNTWDERTREFLLNTAFLRSLNPDLCAAVSGVMESETLLAEFFENLNGRPYQGLYVIGSHPDFERIAKRKAVRRRKLYNGMIQCQLYMYF